jgi:hypothetical protein
MKGNRMSRLRAIGLVLAAAAVALWPAPARAESDVLSWFEELSGPGPFYSIPMLSGGIRLVCGSRSEPGGHLYAAKYGTDADNARPCLENTRDITWYVYAHYTYTRTGDKSQFGEPIARSISAHAVDVYIRLRVNPAVDLGMGVGATYFTDGRGSGGFDAIGNATYTPVNVVVRPAQLLWKDNKWTRSFGIVYSQAVRFSTLTSVDFGGGAGLYSSKTELNARWVATFDPGPFFFSRK